MAIMTVYSIALLYIMLRVLYFVQHKEIESRHDNRGMKGWGVKSPFVKIKDLIDPL